MKVYFTPEQEAFVRTAIESGRLQSAEDAIQQALILWEKRERNRLETLAGLDEAEADLVAGQYDDYTDEALPLLSEQLKAEARASRVAKPSLR